MDNIFKNFINLDQILKNLHENDDFSDYLFWFEQIDINEDFRYRLNIKKKSDKSETNRNHFTSITIGVEGGIEKTELSRLIQILKDNIQIKKHHKQL